MTWCTNHDRRLASEQLLATALRRKVNLSQRTRATKEGPSAARYEGTSTDRYQGTSAARYELKTASFAPRRNNYQPPATKEGPSAPRYTLWITIIDHENGIRLNGTDRQTVRLQPPCVNVSVPFNGNACTERRKRNGNFSMAPTVAIINYKLLMVNSYQTFRVCQPCWKSRRRCAGGGRGTKSSHVTLRKNPTILPGITSIGVGTWGWVGGAPNHRALFYTKLSPGLHWLSRLN